ncbi:hypothetical protein FR483_n213R [Paramecium bursaria Chlorella virus FR483]|uniref:Uncharacterized protein n213R n=1 Tax=Paramecium bursaria Chlorella virus FR483 TaxID=399781 RepID=A7J6R7_PBCVF|nr:hypothetical protein FR483_n213R [Paramecium bursaria Chlorella virus FR483]ABT15498.1 hypothetical protein FR483_n213R [Paramecium bursaria Chlorella virus FR483]
MANIESSVARFSASLAEIKAAQRHTVVIDLPVHKAVAGKTTKVFIKKAPVAEVPKPASKTSKNTETTERKEYVMPAKKTVKKTSKLGKLVSGKKVYDFTK